MFHLTPQERLVIWFLFSVALAGIGINFLTKNYPMSREFLAFDQDLGKASLNQADQLTLEGIRGIGKKLAQRIIEYRNRSGGFRSIEELKHIKGINSYRYEQLKDFLTIR